tara:strand:+ start:123 stop:1487 length:1365 start_codon:yes stop_codon:yes gene_type:complete
MVMTDSATYSKRRDLMIQSYHDFIGDLQEEGPEEETNGLSPDFLEHFKFIIKSKALADFSPLNFYWVNLVDNLIYVLQMYQDADDEGLTDFWTEGEYAKAYLDLADQGEEPVAITAQLIPLLEGQVLGFYHWHISAHHKAKENPTLYQLVPDIGDHDLGIRVGHSDMIAPPDAHNDSPSLPFWSKSFSEGIVSIDDDGGELVGGIQPLKAIDLDGRTLPIKGSTPELDKNIDEHIVNLDKAIQLIKNASPRCYDALKVFTESIILIDEPGIVSYSLQSLPGYSNINVSERDFVDLVDDLIHENGHHILNAVLNAEELIEEDDDKIFWSPWRQALRPIRGIYHGYLTFCWAFTLFSDLYKSAPSELDQTQMEKVQLRFVDEFIMLKFCQDQLDHAFRLGKINELGMGLVREANKLLEAESEYVNAVIQSKLSPANAAKVSELQTALSKAHKTYLN